jgi:hypothetical protein
MRFGFVNKEELDFLLAKAEEHKNKQLPKSLFSAARKYRIGMWTFNGALKPPSLLANGKGEDTCYPSGMLQDGNVTTKGSLKIIIDHFENKK